MVQFRCIIKQSGILILLMAIHSILNGESMANHLDDSIYIWNDKYEGIVFNGDSPPQLEIPDSLRLEITESDIVIAEAIIYKYLKKNRHKTKFRSNQGSENCPVIFPNLDNYYRQYYGMIDSEGQRIIKIIFFWKNDDWGTDWRKNLISIWGGCSTFWVISVDMDRKKCFDFHVNGMD